MNKTILVAGGTALVSLAAGAVGGYFFANKKLGELFDERLETELKSTRDFYDEQFGKLQEKYMAAVADLEEMQNQEESRLEDEDEALPGPDDDEIAEQETESRSISALRAARALTDYQGTSTQKTLARPAPTGSIVQENKPTLDELVKHNIFADPPRDKSGRFLPRQTDVHQDDEDNIELLEMEEFLSQSMLPDGQEYEQENLRYFIKDDTLVDTANETVENSWVGEVNLTLFPEAAGPGQPRIICVRNHTRRMDYEILLVEDESLTDYLGFGTEADV